MTNSYWDWINKFKKNPPVYECDPKKNTECRKTGCMYNEVNPGGCHLTTHKEFERDEIDDK